MTVNPNPGVIRRTVELFQGQAQTWDRFKAQVRADGLTFKAALMAAMDLYLSDPATRTKVKEIVLHNTKSEGK